MNTVRIEITYCDTCGGLRKASWSTTEIATTFLPISYTLCPGHPELKHDGKLPPKGHQDYAASVEIFDNHPPTSLVCISGGYAPDTSMYLDPQQALSLLVWLKQEEQILQELTKGQEINV